MNSFGADYFKFRRSPPIASSVSAWPMPAQSNIRERTISSDSSDWGNSDPWQFETEPSTMFPFMSAFVANQFPPQESENQTKGWVEFKRPTPTNTMKLNFSKFNKKKKEVKLPVVNVEIIWKETSSTPSPEPPNPEPPAPPPLPRDAKGPRHRKIPQPRKRPKVVPQSGVIILSDDEILSPKTPHIPLSHEEDAMLERFPAKAGVVPTQGTNVQPSTGINSSKTVEKRTSGNSNSDDEDDARFLLSKLDDLNLSSKEKEQQNSEDGQRSLFVQELLLSIFAEGADADPVASSPLHMQRAVATDCPLLASTPNRTTSTEDSSSLPDNQSPIETNKSTSNNNDTGVGHSMLSGSSPLAQSLSSGLHGSSLLDVQPTGSRSAPHLAPGGGDRVSSDPERWVYREEEDSKDSDEDKPPSPTPMLGLRMPGRMFAAGPLRVTAGVGGAAVNDFNRDEVPTSTLTKHIR